MEIAVAAPIAGIVEKIGCATGALVSAGQRLVTLRIEARMKPSERADVEQAYDRIAREPLAPVWIPLVPREAALARARTLETDTSAASKPLYGMTFAVKDNIDLAGLPTTAGCPAFAYRAGNRRAGGDTIVRSGRHSDRQDEHGPVRNWTGRRPYTVWRVFQRFR